MVLSAKQIFKKLINDIFVLQGKDKPIFPKGWYNIPNELVSMPNWLCSGTVKGQPKRIIKCDNGNICLNGNGGFAPGAGFDKAENQLSFDNMVSAFVPHLGKAGINPALRLMGAEIPNHGYIYCIDIDDCLTDLQKVKQAHWSYDFLCNQNSLISKKKCYVEISSSGKGLHIFGYAHNYKGIKLTHSKDSIYTNTGIGKVEIYNHNQYIVITGDIWNGCNQFGDISPFLGYLADHSINKSADKVSDNDTIKEGERHTTLITRAVSAYSTEADTAKATERIQAEVNKIENPNTFDSKELENIDSWAEVKGAENKQRNPLTHLLDNLLVANGSTKVYDKGLSTNPAELLEDKRVADKVAAWLQANPLSRGEQLKAAKMGIDWFHTDYLPNNPEWKPPAKTIMPKAKPATAADVEVTDEYIKSLYPAEFTDLEQAGKFVELYGNWFQYNPSLGWLAYDNFVWNIDSEITVNKAVNDMILKQNYFADEYVEKYCEFSNTEAKKAFHKDLKRQKAKATIYNIRELAKDYLYIDVGELNKNPLVLCTPGGVYDLNSAKLLDAARSRLEYCTYQTAVAPSADGMDIWLDHLKKVFLNDQPLIDYFQRICGEFIIGRVNEAHLINAYNSVGRNGKSVTFNVLAKVLGNGYAKVSRSELLTVKGGSKAEYYLAELVGARMVIFGETGGGELLNDRMLKKLTTGDPIQVDKKHQKPFEYIPAFNPVLYTNHLLRFAENDISTINKTIVIPFDAHFADGETGTITRYDDYLFENCGGAILQWCMEGAKKLIDNNFKLGQMPERANEATKHYRNSADWLQDFLDNACVLDDEEYTKKQALYDHYKNYCKNYNVPFTRCGKQFYEELAKKGFQYKQYKTQGSNRCYKGIGIRNDY